MSKNIVLLGASLESDNRGVNALGIGALTLLKYNYKSINPNIITLGPQEKTVEKYIWVDNNKLLVKIHYFNSKTLYFASLTSYRSPSTNKLINIINESDLFYDINEGDSFSDIYGFKRILRHFADANLVLKLNKELVFLPQTIGPFNTLIGKILSKQILSRLNKIYVRDEKFVHNLNQLGLKFTKTIDMAVYMSPSKVDFKVPANTIGLNVNGLMFYNSYKSMEGKYNYYKMFIKELIDSFICEGFSIILIPHTYNQIRPNREDDLEAIKDLKNTVYSQNNNVLYFDKDYDAQQIKYIISQTIFFAGSRMHSCIAALSRSVPTVGLAYSYKFSGTFNMFSCGDHVLNLVNLKKEEIPDFIKKIHAIFNNRADTKSKLLETNNRELLKL
ncbi:polysaccharide pyruvyl transferase family protein [Formosa algae]|uniref:Polysaccharide pyruvyl transferase WcaK-like protein n=1 Tax=Formosa algae TaxID=225843 RepID=A0A9X0YI07_9FLAO|nr:polysaccharide pyruvyl transferase family protein [Formosa algae]MBP1838706.1 polysaccharide pyruvyl transferase WcaK-like protein [Formosa algae]MDQ0335206.1 polysaccharide pyruvyl transferase WcaK-like protein [Formosa algae]OEI81640.1 hypothetical protein AST99_02875 [Formosa algae]